MPLMERHTLYASRNCLLVKFKPHHDFTVASRVSRLQAMTRRPQPAPLHLEEETKRMGTETRKTSGGAQNVETHALMWIHVHVRLT